MRENLRRVAILVHNYFEQAEFEEPLHFLKNIGLAVTVITTSDDLDLRGLYHVEKGDKFQADLLIGESSPDDYDVLVLPGGAINSDALRVIKDAKNWAADFLNSGKLVAAICHAPWLLVSADLVDGTKLTSYPTIADDIRNAGGDWVDKPVVIDDNLITSRKPVDLPLFNKAIVEELGNQRAFTHYLG